MYVLLNFKRLIILIYKYSPCCDNPLRVSRARVSQLRSHGQLKWSEVFLSTFTFTANTVPPPRILGALSWNLETPHTFLCYSLLSLMFNNYSSSVECLAWSNFVHVITSDLSIPTFLTSEDMDLKQGFYINAIDIFCPGFLIENSGRVTVTGMAAMAASINCPRKSTSFWCLLSILGLIITNPLLRGMQLVCKLAFFTQSV